MSRRRPEYPPAFVAPLYSATRRCVDQIVEVDQIIENGRSVLAPLTTVGPGQVHVAQVPGHQRLICSGSS